MRANFLGLAVLATVGCTSDPDPAVQSVEPSSGSVAGGTRLTIHGAGLTSATRVTVGGVECGALAIASGDRIQCTTGATQFIESTGDVVVTTDRGVVTLPSAFAYSCPWQTSMGRRTCGAAPAAPAPTQAITSWVTDVEVGHAFVVDGSGPANLDDTEDFANGSRAAWIETDGAGTSRTLSTTVPGTDMTGQLIKVWLEVDNLAAVSQIELRVGDAALQNYYAFRLSSTQGQQWLADRQWVSFTLSWSPDACAIVGTPNRADIRGIGVRVIDDATGPVRLHFDGLALVPEPAAEYPTGVLSFTFDDNWLDVVTQAAPPLARHAMGGTVYAIVDLVGKPQRATLDDLQRLQTGGWDIAAHAFTSIHHDARFPTLAPSVVEDELVDTRAWLMTNGFTAFDHCAYPGGDFSNGGTDITPIAARYFTTCRTIYQRQREAVPPADPMKLRVLYVTSGTTLETVTTAVDHARDNHEWIILVFHKLVDGTPATLTEWPAASFATLVDHVAASGIRVEPVSRVLPSR